MAAALKAEPPAVKSILKFRSAATASVAVSKLKALTTSATAGTALSSPHVGASLQPGGDTIRGGGGYGGGSGADDAEVAGEDEALRSTHAAMSPVRAMGAFPDLRSSESAGACPAVSFSPPRHSPSEKDDVGQLSEKDDVGQMSEIYDVGETSEKDDVGEELSDGAERERDGVPTSAELEAMTQSSVKGRAHRVLRDQDSRSHHRKGVELMKSKGGAGNQRMQMELDRQFKAARNLDSMVMGTKHGDIMLSKLGRAKVGFLFFSFAMSYLFISPSPPVPIRGWVFSFASFLIAIIVA